MKINITSMNQKITFQKKEIIKLPGGDTQTEYTDFITVFANVSLTNAKEDIDETNKTVNGFSKRIICRFIKDVKPCMRIKNGSEMYNIINIENIDNKNMYLSIIAENFKE